LARGAFPADYKPFTVDVMVKTEGVAEALFSPDGAHLLIEKAGPYDTSPSFGWERLWSRDLSTLMRADIGAAPAQLTPIDPQERVWIGSYSPSGQRAAVGWFDGAKAKSGIYDFRTGELRKLDLLITNLSIYTCAFDCPLWLSEDRFVHYTVSPELQARQLSETVYTVDATTRWSHDSWEGKTPAVKILGSGAHQGKEIEEGGRIVEVDTRTGVTRTLGEGAFFQMALSPDRKRLAVIRETGQLDISKVAAVSAAYGSDRVMALEIYDFTRDGALVRPCESSNVTNISVRWSPGGSKLIISARTLRVGQFAHQQYVYDFARAKLVPFEPRGIEFKIDTDIRLSAFVSPVAWLDEDTLAARVTRDAGKPAAPSVRPSVRYDWYALKPGGAPTLLTGGLGAQGGKDRAPLADFVAVHAGRLLMMADGDLWSLARDGKRENLTLDVPEELSPWCSVIAYWRGGREPPVCGGLRTEFFMRGIDEAALARDWMTFRILKDDVWTGEVLFLNLRTHQQVRVARPNAESELVTASALAQAAVFRSKEVDGDRVTLARAGAAPVELLHINRQLEGVAGGTPVMLRRREPGDEDDRTDWLLLPPDHQPGDRHPLLVYFYPDTQFSKQWESDDLRDVYYINQNIPAAHGFAVLFASMRISTMQQRGDPMLEMHEQLVHAAENVVAQGYADPQRWALMGHSYGGYGTNCVITQTDRFKAAISMSGPANLTSSYAVGLQQARATAVTGSQAFGVSWSEGGQGRMGVPPWKDPERYIRNSPLFKADQIRTPLLLIHGQEDFVNIGEAEQMFNAMQRQGKDAVLLRYWGEGHNFNSPANMRDMWARIYDWLDKYLDIARDAQGHVILENHQVKSARRPN
jgi:dienelactone hydrolase